MICLTWEILAETELSGIINRIKNMEKTVFLVKKSNYKSNWQLPIDVTDYIRENFKLIDQIEMFDVYVKEN